MKKENKFYCVLANKKDNRYLILHVGRNKIVYRDLTDLKSYWKDNLKKIVKTKKKAIKMYEKYLDNQFMNRYFENIEIRQVIVTEDSIVILKA